jgi:hypothetical protein
LSTTSDDRKLYQASLLEIIGDRPVAYHPKLAKMMGGVKAAIMLSQLLYWNGDKTVQKRDGWVLKSVEDFLEETGLSKFEQQSARDELIERGIIETKLKGIPRIWHYKIDMNSLGEFLVQWETHSTGNSPVLGEKVAQLNKVLETTTENTEESPNTFSGEESLENQENKSEEKKESETPLPLNASQLRYAQAQAIADVCFMDIKLNKGMLLREAKLLDKSPEDIFRLYGAGSPWYRQDWRGKKGENPTPALIRATWKEVEQEGEKHAKNPQIVASENATYVTLNSTPRGESKVTPAKTYINPDGSYNL